MPQYLIYLLPPLLGAFIGYVTNYIAIRMLFRPLRPWRLLGVRVPLTPGIIPAKRGELAQRMGDMVGSHLLTADDVGRALEKKSFRRDLQGAVGEKLGGFLDRELGPLASLVPSAYHSRFRDLIDLLRWKAVKTVSDYLESPVFEGWLRSFLQRRGDELLARDLESFLTPERYERVRSHLDERLTTFLRSDGMRRGVENFVDSKAEQWLNSERSIRELLPADLVEIILSQMEKEIPPLLEKFGGLLYDPEFRERLVKKGKVAIEGFLDSLGGLSGLMAGFINLDKVYAQLPEFLDRAGDEIARWLREAKTQAQVAAMLRERVDDLLDRSPAVFLEKVPYEKVAGAKKFVRVRAVEMVQSRRAADTALHLAERGIGRLKDRSFGSLLQSILPPGGVDSARQDLTDRLLATLRSATVKDALEAIVAEKLEDWVFRHPLGKLSSRLPADAREELEEALFAQLAELLKREVPPLIDSLNVRRMVEEKINTLEILKVEELLMGVMKEQFKYINLFGALLGFLIGLVNLLVLSLP